DFDHTGDLLLLEQGNALLGTYRAGLLDTTDGTTPTPFDVLSVPSWAAADTLFGVSVEGGSPEFTRAVIGSDGRVGERDADGVVVQGGLAIADLEIDTGKDQMLIRYRDPKSGDVFGDSSLTRVDPWSLEYGPAIRIEGLVMQAISRTGD